MVSVFNIEPNIIPIKTIYNSNVFDFLDIVKVKYNIHIDNYYSLLISEEDFKIKNIYNFIFLRLNKINKIYNKIDTIKKINYNISKNEFNDIIKKYIKNDIIKTIIIINSIQLYFFPKLRN